MLTAAPAVAGLGPMSDGFDNAVVHLWDASKLSDATRYMAGRVSDDPGEVILSRVILMATECCWSSSLPLVI